MYLKSALSFYMCFVGIFHKMGNHIDSGFNIPPPNYLREIRRQTNRQFRDIATMSKRQDSISKKKKEVHSKGRTELSKCERNFITESDDNVFETNPCFNLSLASFASY